MTAPDRATPRPYDLDRHDRAEFESALDALVQSWEFPQKVRGSTAHMDRRCNARAAVSIIYDALRAERDLYMRTAGVLSAAMRGAPTAFQTADAEPMDDARLSGLLASADRLNQYTGGRIANVLLDCAVALQESRAERDAAVCAWAATEIKALAAQRDNNRRHLEDRAELLTQARAEVAALTADNERLWVALMPEHNAVGEMLGHIAGEAVGHDGWYDLYDAHLAAVAVLAPRVTEGAK